MSGSTLTLYLVVESVTSFTLARTMFQSIKETKKNEIDMWEKKKAKITSGLPRPKDLQRHCKVTL